MSSTNTSWEEAVEIVGASLMACLFYRWDYDWDDMPQYRKEEQIENVLLFKEYMGGLGILQEREKKEVINDLFEWWNYQEEKVEVFLLNWRKKRIERVLKEVSLSSYPPLSEEDRETISWLPLARRMVFVQKWTMPQEGQSFETILQLSLEERINPREIILSWEGWKPFKRATTVLGYSALGFGFLAWLDENPTALLLLCQKGLKLNLFQEKDFSYDKKEESNYMPKLLFGHDWERILSHPSLRGRDGHDLKGVFHPRKWVKILNPKEKENLLVLLEVVRPDNLHRYFSEIPEGISGEELRQWAMTRVANESYTHLGVCLVSNPVFATEALKWQMGRESYKYWENLYFDSQEIPSPFPIDKVWGEEGLKGYFLKREDVRGVFLGEHTNCCQHPCGAGFACARHGQVNPNGGFFVIEDRTGKIIAQSWVWVDSKQNGVCFDNIEALTLGSREEAVKSIYTQAANFLVGLGFQSVTHGEGVVMVGITKPKKRLYPRGYGEYRDSHTQWLIAQKKEEPLDI